MIKRLISDSLTVRTTKLVCQSRHSGFVETTISGRTARVKVGPGRPEYWNVMSFGKQNFQTIFSKAAGYCSFLYKASNTLKWI